MPVQYTPTALRAVGVREIPGWGTVFRLPGLRAEWDGAPIVNAGSQLVGIARLRYVEGEQVSFALPIRWLFDLFRGTLSSKLDDLQKLQEWTAWTAEHWDNEYAMTHTEYAKEQHIDELSKRIRRLNRSIRRYQTQPAGVNSERSDSTDSVSVSLEQPVPRKVPWRKWWPGVGLSRDGPVTSPKKIDPQFQRGL